MSEIHNPVQPEFPEVEQVFQKEAAVVSTRRIRLGLAVTAVGFLIFILGTSPGIIGLDRSPVIGFVQISVFLVGLGLMCLGGYITLMAHWNLRPHSIAVDIGTRLIATGMLFAVFTGMADVFGLGSHPLSGIPFFGPWQALGVMIGEFLIAMGLLLSIPWRKVDD